MVVAQQFEAENAEEDRVGDEIFERDHAPAVILHRPVRTFRKRCRSAECDRFDRRFAAQFVAQPAHLVVAVEYIVAKHENVFRVVSQRRIDQVACLRIDGQRGGEHRDGDCVLNDDQHFAVYLLRAVPQRSAHDVHRFVAGYQRRRYDARNEAQREQEQCVPCDPLRCRCRRDVDLRAEQPCGVGFGRFGQQKGDGECRAAHQSRFEDQFEHDFPFRRAQQAARGHLLGAESGLCGRQVDVVDDGEEQDDDADCHEDRHERAVARREVPVAVEGRKIDLPQGQERYLPVKVADVRQIDRFEIVEHVGKFGPQVGPFACQQKGAARPYIAHAFVVIVLLRQQIAAVEQVDRRDDRTLDVAHHGADGVALPLGDERTPHGIGVAEHPARERFGEDDVVACGELEVEDAEEGRVGVEYVGQCQLAVRLYGMVIFERYGAGGFDLGVAVQKMLLQEIGAGDGVFVAYDVDPAGLRVEAVDGELPDGVVRDQDDEHERQREAEDVDGRVELVAPQEVEKRTEVELPEHNG